MEFAPGARLGPYEVRDRLGRGGMGEVYGAWDTRLDRSVALKVLPTELADDPEQRKRLFREARSAASLSHPNICTLYDVGEDNGQAFIAMEQIPGSTLAELLHPDGLPQETVLRYGMQIADALTYAHGHGVVHRDLKCTNIMVTPEGMAKIVDFGLARRLERDDLQELTRSREQITAKESVAGTLTYMAPEVLSGELVDARCDIWALGVVLHVMISGTLPFTGRTPFELTASILREVPRPLPAAVLPGLKAIVRRCLTKDVTVRYQRAGEVKAALESAYEDAVLGGRSQTIASRVPPAVTAATDETTLAFDAGSPSAASAESGAGVSSSSSVEIQTLNRIAGALTPLAAGARIVAAVSVGVVLLGFLGLVTGATFDLALHVPLEGSVLDYVIFGLRAVIPPIVLMMIDAAVMAGCYGVVRLVTWLVARARGFRDRKESSRGVLGSMRERLEAAEPRAIIAWLVALSVIAVGVVTGVSWPMLRTIEQLIETPIAFPVDTVALSPSNHSYHFLASWIAATTLLLLGAGWLLGLSALRRRAGGGLHPVLLKALGIASILAVAILTVLPWRTLWANDRERIALDGQTAFIVTESEDRLFLYVPGGAERSLEVDIDDARVERRRSSTRESIFTQP